MDNCNVQFFKDGSDIIVVFKNASSDLSELITKMMLQMTTTAITEISDVKPPEPVKIEKPSNFDEYEEMLPDFLNDDYGEPIDNIVEPKPETVVEDAIKIDFETATKAELGTFLETIYEKNKTLIDIEMSRRGYRDLVSFVNFANEEVIRSICLMV